MACFFVAAEIAHVKIGWLLCGINDSQPRYGDIAAEWESKEEFDQFATAHLPLFRRNCWLSGCAIEASAHEKAEWMRRFTLEEIELWNLKF